MARMLAMHPASHRSRGLWRACARLVASCIGGYQPLFDAPQDGIIQVVGPSGVPPFGASAARDALQLLLFRFDLWTAPECADASGVLDDMLVFAAANTRMVALFVPQTRIAGALTSLSVIDNSASVDESATQEAGMTQCRIRLTLLARLLIQHAVGQEDELSNVLGIRRVSLREYETRRIYK